MSYRQSEGGAALMDLYIEARGDSGHAGLRSLFDWLRLEDDLRGTRIGWAPAQPNPGEMGALSDVLVVSLGAGGLAWLLSSR